MNKLWPSVSVIIPHYNNPEGLDLLLHAIAAQNYDGEIEVIVADDGSDVVPHPVIPGLEIRVVAQQDQGFRAAAARNLGASAARGEILAFLDGDTVPRPGYLRAAVGQVVVDGRTVVVGTRVHGDGQEPEWLRQAWSQTENLAKADDSSWRFVISAVLTCSRRFFEDIGGFDGSMVGYGGEDWEFAWRCWNHGALLWHEESAVADHREEDWGGRQTDAESAAADKNVETIALASRVTHPLARPDGGIFNVADIEVSLDPAGWPSGVFETVALEWLALGDVHIVTPATSALFASDPRVHASSRGARFQITLYAPAFPSATADIRAADQQEPLTLRFTTTDRRILAHASSARGRALEAPVTDCPADEWTIVEEPIRLERRFAGW